MRRWLWLVVLVAPVTVWGDQPSRPPPERRDPAAIGPELAHDLSMLATATPASEADLATLAKSNYTSDAFSKYIDELLRRPGQAAVAARLLRVTGSNSRSLFADTILKQQTVGGKSIYYIHEPCDAARAESVNPWWEMTSTVLVCPDAHRPTVFKAPDGNYCSGVYAAPYQPNSPCGCGPNLIRCMRSEQDKDAFAKAILAESNGTIDWIIKNDLPLQTLFASPESFRLPLVEFLYQRWKVENHDVPSLATLPDWRSWPKDGKWAPRPESKPNEHAGIFTNHFTPQMADSQRLKLAGFTDMLWCESPESVRVQTTTVLDVSNQVDGNLRSKVGWEELAARPLCTSCHARIDYSVQFFGSVQWYYKALHYVADAQQDVEGTIYKRDIDDPRGKGNRNPQGFVKLALAQPEFASCMSRDFRAHAFASADDPGLNQLDDALQAIVARNGTYRELMKATLERYKQRALAGPEVSTMKGEPRTRAERAKLVADFVDDKCSSCHDDKDHEPPSLVLGRGPKWCDAAGADCARLGVQLLTTVVFDRMPKQHPLAAPDKRRFFELLAPLAWPDPRTLAMAKRYFVESPQAPPVHGVDAMLSWIRANEAPGHPMAPFKVPPASAVPSFSATAAAQTAITATKVCATRTDRAACIKQAMNRHALEK